MSKKQNQTDTRHPFRLTSVKSKLSMGDGKVQFHGVVNVNKNETVRFSHLTIPLNSIKTQTEMEDIAAQLQYQFQPRLGHVELHCIGFLRPIIVVPLSQKDGTYKYEMLAGHRQYQLLTQAQFQMQYCNVTLIEGASDLTLANLKKADGIWAPLSGQLSVQGVSLLYTSIDSAIPVGTEKKDLNKKERIRSLGLGVSTVYQHEKNRQRREQEFAHRGHETRNKTADPIGNAGCTTEGLENQLHDSASSAQNVKDAGHSEDSQRDLFELNALTEFQVAGGVLTTEGVAIPVEKGHNPISSRKVLVPADQIEIVYVFHLDEAQDVPPLGFEEPGVQAGDGETP